MNIIKSHQVMIQGENDQYKIELRPLTDEYLPYLYKWNMDPEVLYWTELEDVEGYSPEIVHQIYGGISQNNLCFIVVVNEKIIGECWLQKMNLPEVRAMYASNVDVRRIDLSIGEKEYWGKGIGTLLIHMLVRYAFTMENVDVLHCFCGDFNVRSRRIWEKNGFTLIMTEKMRKTQKGEAELHWRLTREEYMKRSFLQ